MNIPITPYKKEELFLGVEEKKIINLYQNNIIDFELAFILLQELNYDKNQITSLIINRGGLL